MGASPNLFYQPGEGHWRHSFFLGGYSAMNRAKQGGHSDRLVAIVGFCFSLLPTRLRV